MFKISCFADEISADLNGQTEFLIENGIKYVELRSVWDKNVLDLSDEELHTVKRRLSGHGIGVSSIGSPIGKVDIADDFGKHFDRFRRAVQIALEMEAKYIRIFSFYIGKNELDLYEKTVIDRLQAMLEIAKGHGLVLLHENEAGIYGETGARCQRLFESINDASFRAVFDPANFVIAGEDVWNGCFQRLEKFVEYVHVKDAVYASKEVAVAGKGDGRIKDILDRLRDKPMFLSLEPHLVFAGQYKGFSGPELFLGALNALKAILDELGAEYA
jgi:sugar phosphate isomerase/epimerase